LPKAWVRARKRDYYYRRAKQEQLRSRAAYKLLQVNDKYMFIKPSDIVVDLGAAPGGWMQATLRVVSESGFILGVDIKPIAPFEEDNICSIIADITKPETLKTIQSILSRTVNAVISDAAPNVSGIWELDHARQIDLALKSLQIAISVLKLGGNFFVKVFQGDLLKDFMIEMKKYFNFVRLIKPEACRKESAELYVLGMGKR
jgi:23S rRNA (uridine2552-2'-O)-methyltransferase